MNASTNAAEQVPLAERSLAQIAVGIPGATAVFRRRKLDFCCGGTVTLADAATAKHLDPIILVAELEALGEVEPSELPEEASDLITYVETRFHAGHRRDLAELVQLARRVEAVHRDVPSAPHGIADLLAETAARLEEHMAKEEQMLFPMMRRGGHPMITHPIAVMRFEHNEHGERLRRLEAITNDFTPPEEACTTWRALYAGTRQFVDEVMEHIHTENNILFPRFGG